MSIIIKVPEVLRRHVDHQDEIELVGDTVGGVLGNLVDIFPDLNGYLFDDKRGFRNFLNIYLNDEDIRYIGGENVAVKNGDVVMIVPAVAGG